MNLYEAADKFLKSIFDELTRLKLTLEPHWDIDHLCYRVETNERYLEMKSELAKSGELLIESQVNGRLIATFKLHIPIYYQNYQIDLIELPAPKLGKKCKDGFEHFELVCDIPFANIIDQNHNLNFDKSGLAKPFNQELEVILLSGAIKFHHLSLASVINTEANKTVWAALQNSNVLIDLRDYGPLVAGTFPLGIYTDKSDLDILLCASNLEQLGSQLKKTFGNIEGFTIKNSFVDELPTLIVRFTYAQIPFELFAQDRPAIKQRAYQHFLAEEKLLKFGGKTLQNKIRQLRNSELKTEPAFAQALNLSNDPQTDPYEQLQCLQQLSLGDLRKLLLQQRTSYE